jgi:membrane protein YqaA with SNARE-associated domain
MEKERKSVIISAISKKNSLQETFGRFAYFFSNTKMNFWLPMIFLFETFLFLPLDLILAYCCFRNKKDSFYLSTVSAITSSLSGIIGYFIGALAWNHIGKTIISHVFSEVTFAKIVHLYSSQKVSVLFFGGLLPIPFKAITISAGFCNVSFVTFFTIILISRLVRFTAVALAVRLWGETVIRIIDNYFRHVVLFLGCNFCFVITYIWLMN